MRLLPPELINCKSDAERKVFGFLKQISFSSADTALHSLNIGRHEYKRWSEADFVVVTRRGILLLEVKGGRVACKNGYWEFTNRFGETNTKQESPAAQASSAFFSLEKKYLNPSFARELGGVPMGFAVVFPDIPRLISPGASPLPEHPDQITAYDVDCRGHNTFRDFLERALDHWASTKKNVRELSPSVITKIVTALRPNFERVPPLNSQLRHAERDFCQFTEEQYERMDEISDNDRIIVAGGAGTGKTFVAAACARYEASAGRSVLFVTRSPFLASFLRSHDFPENVTVATLDDVAKLEAQRGPWDTLVVDEGQDLCDVNSIETLENALKGGWQKGRWRWFGDPNHQVSPSHPVDEDCHEYLLSLGFRCKLKQNVRNAGQVVQAISTFSGADAGHPRGEPSMGRVVIERADSPQELETAIVRTLRGWLSGEGAAARSDVVVLVDEQSSPEEVAQLIAGKGFRAEPLTERALAGDRDCVLVARIEDFKGLERPLVCIAGLDGNAASISSRAYKAISRANHELVLIAPTQAAEALAEKAAAIAARGVVT
ncbi:hypothetical protein GCM10022276_13020 [Sphingomonas limnosediminicola]|uniref:NERD domain-containing protein n=1 Tax=Sphingomonas limnosediminicola TaxID=940133 RepID=A0ABP7L788_9SPHN